MMKKIFKFPFENRDRKQNKSKSNKEHTLAKNISKYLKRKIVRKPIDTSVTIRTQYLCRELKQFFNLNFILSLIALFSAIITAITSISKNIGDSFLLNFDNILSADTLIFFLCIITILLSVVAFFSTVRNFTPVRFVNKLIQDQFDIEEYTAIFIIKMVFDNVPKILVFRSETWNSYFLPYCHFNPKTIDTKRAKKELKVPLSEILEIDENDFELYDDFTKNDYVTIKKNPSHDGKSKINYRFFYVKFSNPYVGQKFISNGDSYFTWKSKYELGEDKDTRLNNGDVVDIIDELSLLNQSKLAFKERKNSSFDILSQYRIIWNITNECYYSCPICATNSGNTPEYKCSISEDDKLKILLNLSSINGYIEHLDISGGDPLKNEIDRKVIRKANQLFPYTNISVTTTGKALEHLSIDELVQTVKTCDITYDIPYNICNDELSEFRSYQYNYTNFKQLERFSNSGIKIALNIHIPILPVNTDKMIISTILEDLSRINPVQIKFIRLMPVGRMDKDKITDKYNPEEFLTLVNDIMKEKEYKFKISYNCSLGVRIKENYNSKEMCRKCEMLTKKLGIDCNGRVYSCIWAAYIPELCNKPHDDNPFYLGDLKINTLYDILTSPKAIKLQKILKNKASGCRVCAFVSEKSSDITDIKKLLESKDPLREMQNPLDVKRS